MEAMEALAYGEHEAIDTATHEAVERGELERLRADARQQARSCRMKSAAGILQAGIDAMADRAATRDQPSGERSMVRAVATFNALTEAQLSEREGWLFMVCLKLARAQGGGHNPDDYVDGAAYAALAGEAAAVEAAEQEADEEPF